MVRTKILSEAQHVVQDSLSKTTMCYFFERGQCSKGDMCTHAHSINQLSQRPDLKKTSLCEAFAQGKCYKDSDCQFAHGPKELQGTPTFLKTKMCRAATKCKLGEHCRYAHSLSELKPVRRFNSNVSVMREKAEFDGDKTAFVGGNSDRIPANTELAANSTWDGGSDDESSSTLTGRLTGAGAGKHGVGQTIFAALHSPPSRPQDATISIKKMHSTHSCGVPSFPLLNTCINKKHSAPSLGGFASFQHSSSTYSPPQFAQAQTQEARVGPPQMNKKRSTAQSRADSCSFMKNLPPPMMLGGKEKMAHARSSSMYATRASYCGYEKEGGKEEEAQHSYSGLSWESNFHSHTCPPVVDSCLKQLSPTFTSSGLHGNTEQGNTADKLTDAIKWIATGVEKKEKEREFVNQTLSALPTATRAQDMAPARKNSPSLVPDYNSPNVADAWWPSVGHGRATIEAATTKKELNDIQGLEQADKCDDNHNSGWDMWRADNKDLIYSLESLRSV